MELKQLMKTFPKSGKVEWVGIRTGRGEAMTPLEVAEVSVEKGLPGDHYRGANRQRQLTLIQAEHLQAVADILGMENRIDPSAVRRNIVVSGLNLLALKDVDFWLGEVLLRFTGYCHPCSRMEANLGKGGYNAMRGHGGITAMVIQGGKLKPGDTVKIDL